MRGASISILRVFLRDLRVLRVNHPAQGSWCRSLDSLRSLGMTPDSLLSLGVTSEYTSAPLWGGALAISLAVRRDQQSCI